MAVIIKSFLKMGDSANSQILTMRLPACGGLQTTFPVGRVHRGGS